MLKEFSRTSSQGRFVFVIHNQVQHENAASVVEHLPAGSFVFFNTVDKTLSEKYIPSKVHNPLFNLVDILWLRFGNSFTSTDTVIIPQDLGIAFRAIAKNVERSNARLVLMPDGIASSIPVSNGNLLRRSVKEFALKLLQTADVISKSAGIFGGSDPDLILRWGPGWSESFQKNSSKIVDVGCPRMDSLWDLDPSPETVKLLLCSQPLQVSSWTRPFAEEWYNFLLKAVENLKGFEIRLRLHPAEDPMALPEGLRELVTTRNLLLDDLEWASHVAAPFSTVLLEARVAGRKAIQLSRNENMRARSKGYPFFSSSQVIHSSWDVEDLLKSLRVSDADGVSESTMRIWNHSSGHAGKSAARALTSFARFHEAEKESSDC